MCALFFFFKQKTAYEMRISDWSSDVCSSDLCLEKTKNHGDFGQNHRRCCRERRDECRSRRRAFCRRQRRWHAVDRRTVHPVDRAHWQRSCHLPGFPGRNRSEEHTSELQSLMRISYAVFCLQKKKNTVTILKITDTH